MDHLELDRKLHQIVSLRAMTPGNLGSVISDLQQFPILYAIAYWGDRGASLIIFLDPHHTVSYNIAIRAKAGDPLAIELCQALNLLSPDHCAWALQNEELLRIAA